MSEEHISQTLLTFPRILLK